MTPTDARKTAEEIADEAINYGMGAPWPDQPPQNPLPICEQDLIDRITQALTAFAEQRTRELKEALKKYGRHGHGKCCYAGPCNCGLEEILKS